MQREEDVFNTIRFPRSLYAEIEKLALASDRTVAAEIRMAVRKHLEENEATGSSATRTPAASN